MAKILVHALAATAGGGANYLRNFLEHLVQQGQEHHWLALVPGDSHIALNNAGPNIEILPGKSAGRALRRVYYDQVSLRQLVANEGVDLILATGNFGMIRPPVPQVLLNRNALYFSMEHLRQLRRRGEVRELLNTLLRHRMALASIRDSALNIVPTAAFGDEIRDWVRTVPEDRFRVIPHGFAHDKFVRPRAELSPAIADKLDRRPGVRRVLMVSHYNYFRNFETLIKAIGHLRQTFDEPVELILTTNLGFGVKDHRYDTTKAACLIESLGIKDQVTMLGTVPHSELYPLYRRADVVVCPSYAESFGHPMVEAMASGRPVVASDRPEHREVCRDSALHFPVFDHVQLADRIRQILTDAALAERLGANGIRRANDFCWRKHFQSILETIQEALATRERPCQTTPTTA